MASKSDGYDYKKGGIQPFGGKFSGVERYVKKNGVISFYIKYKDLSNQTKRVKVGDSPAMTKTEALKRLRAVTGELNDIRKSVKESDSNNVFIPKRKKKTFSATTSLKDLAEYYIERKSNIKDYPNIQSKYKNHIEKDEIVNIPLAILTRDDIAAFVKRKKETYVVKNGQQRKKQKNPDGTVTYLESEKEHKARQYKLTTSTVNAIYNLIVVIINYAIKNEKFFGRNPFHLANDDDILKEIERPKEVHIKQLTQSETKAFLSQLKAQSESFEITDRYVYLIGLLAVFTGARMRTILNIKVGDIDFEHNKLKLYNLKVKDRPYTIHISSQAMRNQLEKFSRGKRPDDYLFTSNRTGKQIYRYPRVMKKILDLTVNNFRTKKEYMTLRDLRNSLASTLASKKVPLYNISQILNHDSLLNTKRYAQLQYNYANEEIANYAMEVNLEEE